MPETVSLREFARGRQVSPSYAHRLKQRGTLVMVGGKVDVKASNAAIEADRDPTKGFMAEINERQRATHKAKREAAKRKQEKPAAQQVPSPVLESGSGTYSKARAAREVYQARMSEIDYMQAIGMLVSVDDLQQVAVRRYRALREKLLNIPERIASVLAAESNPEKVRAGMVTEIKRVLNELADDAASEVADGVEKRMAAGLPSIRETDTA